MYRSIYPELNHQRQQLLYFMHKSLNQTHRFPPVSKKSFTSYAGYEVLYICLYHMIYYMIKKTQYIILMTVLYYI